MELSSVIHRMNESFSYKLKEHEYVLKLITKKNDFKSIKVGYLEKYFREKDMKLIPSETFYLPMRKVASTDANDYYEAVVSDEIPLNGVTERVEAAKKMPMHPFLKRMAEGLKDMEGKMLTMLSLAYYFILDDGNSVKYYGNYKFSDKEPYHVLDMFNMVIYQTDSIFFETPEWSKGAVIYQIFPERFAATGDKYSEEWFKVPMDYRTRTNGTLKGITQKVPYLKKLGIDAIYLNPIFLANSPHRYDTRDYMVIDPPLGTEEDLKELVDTLHANGMKIILDLVFNHSSADFFAFQDLLKNQENSKYRDWYFIKKFPVEMKMPSDYMGFSFSPGMPKLNTSNPECRKYLLGVVRHYLEDFHVDGYRLDVANEVTHDFWREFRKLCKSINPDCLIMGEIWYDSSMYLRGDEFDSVMNYTFFDAIRGYLDNKFSLGEFVSMIERERGETSLCCYHNSNILVGSHDTDRIYHAMKQDAAKYRLAMALLLMLPGSPLIYYGDEKMMDGDMDPDCRRGMIFDEDYNKDSFCFVRKLIGIHHRSSVKSGDIRILSDEGYLSFSRFDEKESLTVFLNASKESFPIQDMKGKTDLLTGEASDGMLEPWSVLVFEA